MSVHHDLEHADDDGLPPGGHLPAGPDPLTDAVIAEIRQGHQILATELARLNAAMAASRRSGELDATTDLSGAIVPAYLSSASAWDGPDGRVQRAGARQPDPQRVVHLGSERTPRPVDRRSAIAAGAAAGGVGAVVVVVLAVLILGPRLATDQAGADAGIAGVIAPTVTEEVAAEQTAAPEAAAPEAAAPEVAAPVAVTSPAIAAVLTRAAAEAATLDAPTQQLVERLATVQGLQGPARAEEAADVYGVAVQVARDDPEGVAAEMVEALAPEVTMEAALMLATQRPEVVGVGMAPLVDDFNDLASLPAELQRAEAQALLDQVIAETDGGTISGPYCNVADHVLRPYLPTT